MRPLRTSLTLGVGRDLLLAVLAFAVLLLVLLTVQLGLSERDLRQRSLDEAAQYLASHLQTLPDGRLHLPMPTGSSWSTFGYPAIVFDADGKVLYKRPSTLRPELVDLLAQQQLSAVRRPHRLGAIRFFTAAPGDQQIIAASLSIGDGPSGRVIIVFKDEKAPDVLVDDVVRQFPYRSAEVMLPILALLLLGGAWIIRRRVRPIALVSGIAATIGPHTLNLRLPEADLPGEVLPLVQGVNGALARLETAAAAQREFLARAAHHLRTPMTVLSARVDGMSDAQTAAALRADIHEMSRIVRQLLDLNEIDALPESGDVAADLGAVGEAVRDELLPAAKKQAVDIVLIQPAATVLVRGDPNLIEFAVRNLVENALQHAPRGSAVELRVEAAGTIAISDRGPGVPEAFRTQLFEPFWSGDPQGWHAGLGLTIVQRVAERCGATVVVEDVDGDGARFVMRFRPAPDAGANIAATIPVSLALRRRRHALSGAAE